jgi:cyclophilin family peptidyl-prolyl cis-trans isomerase
MPRRYEEPPAMALRDGLTYRAVLHTARGDITISLLPGVAPRTVNSFVFLAEEGFFAGCTFHRVIPGFIAQTGDPTGTGRGTPGYRLPDELSDEPFEAGAVAMANAGPDSNGSQFFVALDDARHLDGRFTLFGRVVEGLEVARTLTPRDAAAGSELPRGDALQSVEIVTD